MSASTSAPHRAHGPIRVSRTYYYYPAPDGVKPQFRKAGLDWMPSFSPHTASPGDVRILAPSMHSTHFDPNPLHYGAAKRRKRDGRL